MIKFGKLAKGKIIELVSMSLKKDITAQLKKLYKLLKINIFFHTIKTAFYNI